MFIGTGGQGAICERRSDAICSIYARKEREIIITLMKRSI
ncbi:hypothetical protein bthur0012_53670 [Bacillus thuringiensis serovar pulsiensis BGSC 4CC1]|nr:hypothetical protein bthur0012_53670 [Bacillus thuringiensis serovar pulsiensis BGSC 4CC1]